jgi:hypothetical protein
MGPIISVKAGWPFDALFCQKNGSNNHQKSSNRPVAQSIRAQAAMLFIAMTPWLQGILAELVDRGFLAQAIANAPSANAPAGWRSGGSGSVGMLLLF